MAGTRYATRARVQEFLEVTATQAVVAAVSQQLAGLDQITVDALLLKANEADLTAHTGNTSNPHSVTKIQVGLGNVDNTSDANKPISTAVQAALDLKADATALTDKQDKGDPVLGTVQALTGDGAASLTDLVTTLTTDAATQAVTLADGAAGQIKVVALAAQLDPADVATVTPATALGFTSFDLTAPGQSVTLLWVDGWVITSINGATIT